MWHVYHHVLHVLYFVSEVCVLFICFNVVCGPVCLCVLCSVFSSLLLIPGQRRPLVLSSLLSNGHPDSYGEHSTRSGPGFVAMGRLLD